MKYGDCTRQIRQNLSGTGSFDLRSPWVWLTTLGRRLVVLIGHNSNTSKLFTVDLKVHFTFKDSNNSNFVLIIDHRIITKAYDLKQQELDIAALFVKI